MLRGRLLYNKGQMNEKNNKSLHRKKRQIDCTKWFILRKTLTVLYQNVLLFPYSSLPDPMVLPWSNLTYLPTFPVFRSGFSTSNNYSLIIIRWLKKNYYVNKTAEIWRSKYNGYCTTVFYRSVLKNIYWYFNVISFSL